MEDVKSIKSIQSSTEPQLAMKDEEIIYNASGGLALCGIRMDGSKQQRPMKQILGSPSKCQLQAPRDAHAQLSLSFRSEEASTQFLDTIEESGWTVAFDLFSLARTQIDRSKARSAGSALDAKVAMQCTMQITYAPARSFHITKEQMRISEEAMADLQDVHTLSRAKEFLNQYHSHVSTGVFHLGAVHAQWTISGHWAQSSSSNAERSDKLTGSTGILVNANPYIKAGIGMKREARAVIADGTSKTEDAKSCRTWAVGVPTPGTKDREAFLASVEKNPSSWAIINSTRTSAQVFVAVWDLVFMTCDKTFWRSAELLRAAWQSEAAGNNPTGVVFDLLQASLKGSAISPPSSDGDHESRAQADKFLSDRAQNQTLEFLTGSMPTSKMTTKPELPGSCLPKPLKEATSESFGAEAPDQLLDPAIHWLPTGESLAPAPGDNTILPIGNFESLPVPVVTDEDMQKQSVIPIPEPSSFQAATHQQQPDPSLHEPAVTEALQTSIQPTGAEVLPMQQGSGNDTQQIGPQFTYINDFLTHRRFPQPHKHRNIIDRISHALPPFENFKQQLANEDEFWGGGHAGSAPQKDADTEANLLSALWSPLKSSLRAVFGGGAADVRGEYCHCRQELEDPVIEEGEAAKSIVYIYENSDFLGQITLLRLLLDQRWGVPLVFSSTSTTRSPSKQVPRFHTVQALRYVLTGLGSQANAKEFVLLLANDMPCVVFLSNHCNREHERMAQQVTKFRFLPFPYSGEDQALYIQLGIGFLPESKRRPYLAVVVSGAYTTSSDKQCLDFLNAAADMVFLQVQRTNMGKSITAVAPLLTCEAVQWAIDSSGLDGKNPATKEIWGSFTEVAKQLTMFLKTKWSPNRHPLRQKASENLRSICTSSFDKAPRSGLMDEHDVEDLIEDTLRETKFETLRDRLVLQRSFLQEATTRFESLKLKHNSEEKQKKHQQCNNEARKREQNAGEVAEIPIIRTFLRILQHEDSSTRSTGILKLKNFMQRRSQTALLKLREMVDSAFKEFQSTPTQESQGRYSQYRDQHAGRVIGLEHLWREVSHIFLTNPRGHSGLPKLAARHLLDGFPLEIVDGDAKFFNDVWVQAVLSEVQQLIQGEDACSGPPRILVLSILGTQSSGKTTLLNVMFGTDLPTKAGRCTCGVHIQLIKSQWDDQYDYILLMDTEGIKGPEHYGAQQYLSHDNRMATFAILPSDACIMVVAGEDDSNLKDVLPLVLLAFKGSTVAQKSGGRLRSKMLFVYRSVDINEQEELKSNRQALLEYLVKAEGHIMSQPPHDYTNGVDIPNAMGSDLHALGGVRALFEFRVDDKEDLSDVKFLGNYRRDSTPPEDIPDSKYGEKVLQVRDYLHERVTGDPKWTAFDFKELGSYMNLVWSCILQADFELSFKSSVEYRSYMELQQMLQLPRTLVSRSYVEELEEMERVDRSFNINDQSLEGLQFLKVKPTIREQTKKVEDILANSRWLITWKAEEHQKWKDFLEQQERWFKMQLHDHKTGVILFEKLLIECDKRMQQDILALHQELPSDEQISFDTMFSNFLQHARQSYKPLADIVEAQVDRVYSRHKGILEACDLISTGSESEVFYEETSFAELKLRILEPSLRNAKQYSDDLVEEAIRLTSDFIQHRPLTYDRERKHRDRTHAKVKEFVTQCLQDIQRKWDEGHNPAARLETQRDRFHNLYISHTKRYDMANLLLEELKSVFAESLETTLKQSLVKQSCSSLQSEPWLYNWKVMRALLNAVLLQLLQDKKHDQVLDYASQGGLYHRHVLEKLIKSNVKKMAKASLPAFRDQIKRAVSHASEAAAASSGAGEQTTATAVFLDSLGKKLASEMPVSSQICVALLRISPDHAASAGSGGLGFSSILIPALHHRVDEICDGVEKQLAEESELELRNLADMVKKRLIAHNNLSYRTRCEESCPRCGIACMLPAGHHACHNTVHQPQGMKGVVWKSSYELSEKTCTEHYRDGDTFTLGYSSTDDARARHEYAYRAFNKAYPDWENPSVTLEFECPLSNKVQQCLFFHCQSHLVERHRLFMAKPNTKCAHLEHRIQRLRFEIEQELPEGLRAVVDTIADKL